jgi:hypothetical protein
MNLADFWYFLPFFMGILFTIVVQFFIKRAALSLMRGKAGAIGRQQQAAQADDLMALITEAAEAFKKSKEEGQDIKEFAVKVMPGIAMRHPVSVMKFGKKLMDLLNNGKGLGDLLG